MIRWCHRLAVGLFLLTTWGVAVFFIVEFWTWIRAISLLELSVGLLTMVFMGGVISVGHQLRWFTIKQILNGGSIVLFFLSTAGLYSFIGVKLGLRLRAWLESLTMVSSLQGG